MPSGFGVPPAPLPEDTPPGKGSLFSNTSVLHSPGPVSTTVTQTIATYRPPLPADTAD